MLSLSMGLSYGGWVMLTIPKDYWLGDRCVETRTPWLVPGAIRALDDWLKPTDRVLELGSGGSTLFFADRCREVISFELNKAWYVKLNNIIEKEKLRQVRLIYIDNPYAIMRRLKDMKLRFNVVMPDWDGDRDVIRPLLAQILQKRFMVVLDNYGAEGLYPTSFRLEDYLDYAPCEQRVFDDAHWYGKGTRLCSSSIIQ